jgi:hypothetical protein
MQMSRSRNSKKDNYSTAHKGESYPKRGISSQVKKKISAISQPERSSDGNINGARGVEQQEEESKRVKKNTKERISAETLWVAKLTSWRRTTLGCLSSFNVAISLFI